MKTIKRLKKYFNVKNISTEIEKFGYKFSVGNYWKLVLLSFLGIIGVCIFYKCSIISILIIMLLMIILLPSNIISTYRGVYERQRFEDLTNYLDQLIYSFRRRPNLLFALKDTLTVFQNKHGKMAEVIEQAISYIENTTSQESTKELYAKALSIIEREYGNAKLFIIHKFLIKVEGLGGQYTFALDSLLDDQHMWVERMYSLEKQRQDLKRKLALSLVLSFLICGITIYMLPDEFSIVTSTISRLASTVFIIGNILIWYFAQRRLTVNWLTLEESICDNSIIKKMQFLKNYNHTEERNKCFKKFIFLTPGLLVAFFLQNIFLVLLMLCFMTVIIGQPKRKYKQAKKIVQRFIEKVFPSWIYELVLLLQTENVYTALRLSIEEADPIMQDELQDLVRNMELYPERVEPFNEFFSDFDIPEINTAMRILYSLQDFGADETEKRLSALVERNNKLIDKTEKVSSENKLATFSIFALIPFLSGSLKIMVDMVLLIVAMLSFVQP